MKSFIKAAALWAAMLCLIPAVLPSEREEAAAEPVCPGISGELQICGGGEVYSLDPENYAVMAVLGEIPFLPEKEALKAQVCAARTYAARRLMEGTDENGLHIGSDSSLYRICLTEAQARALYGEEYEQTLAAVKEAAEETKGVIITYGGYPAAAAFHISSAGMTESAENILGKDIPYLVPVVSDYSENAVSFTYAELSARMGAEYPEASGFDGITVTERTETGTVMQAELCGIKLSGRELMKLLSLESAAFETDDDGQTVTFTVKGSGHLVGMSLCGADFMAKTGSTYDEILRHYYPGTETGSINGEN